MTTTRRPVHYTVGWKITLEDEAPIARLCESSWETSLTQRGELQEGYQIAELTGVNTRDGWLEGIQLFVRRVRPSRRQLMRISQIIC
ncbi:MULTISPECIES: hypothetical protein [unclassified Streptomyces]|uniref:hypothetical protein n=1 Tax=unclassified Streptomyces TaxID=2593676 RepID=UPI00225708C9|nr:MULTISPECIES: hypothetical protein [unclassified Streptomyces]MCX5327911.1 hypothetical protein [Streptomyces sp. NBC_00140]MCX5357400.1 hypothetical protein [Streptomyces sp. NBC_00124]